MKMLRIFCFIILIVSLSALISNINSNHRDAYTCTRAEVPYCSNTIFESKNFECCVQKTIEIIDGISSEKQKCDAMILPLKDAQEEMNSERGKAIYKEYTSYMLYQSENLFNDTYYQDNEITCSDGSFHLIIDSNNYSEEDIKLSKSEQFCLNHSGNNRDNPVKKDQCFGYKLMTKDPGLSCGYFEFEIKLENDETTKAYICFPFDEDIVKTKNPKFLTRAMIFNTASREFAYFGKEIIDYKVKFSNSKGNTLIYDSATDKVTDSSSLIKCLALKLLLILSLLI